MLTMLPRHLSRYRCIVRTLFDVLDLFSAMLTLIDNFRSGYDILPMSVPRKGGFVVVARSAKAIPIRHDNSKEEKIANTRGKLP